MKRDTTKNQNMSNFIENCVLSNAYFVTERGTEGEEKRKKREIACILNIMMFQMMLKSSRNLSKIRKYFLDDFQSRLDCTKMLLWIA